MSFGTRLRQERLRRYLSQEALAEALNISARSISRWEQDQAVPQATVRLQLSRFFDLGVEDLFTDQEEQTPPSTALWSIPFARNPCFTGREEILHALHRRLAHQQSVSLTQPPALSGLGGIGKTQVAIEYAYRYSDAYSAVFWLAAETTESLIRSWQQIAELLQLPERQGAEQAQMVAAVGQWLASHSGWLLIADNVEDLDLLQRMLPPRRPGALLLTTRQQALGPLAEPLELPVMSREEGLTLLLRRAGQLGRPTRVVPLADDPWRHLSVAPAAAEVVKLLEGLPLALDQAGAYIEETGCGVREYLRRCQDQRKQLLAHRGMHGGAHPASVTTTLQLSIERIEQQHEAAADLLRVCGFLHAEAIPEELLIAGASQLGARLSEVVRDAYQFDLAVAALRSVSLVTRAAETRTLSVHRLVQAVLQDQMEEQEVRMWSERVIRLVNAAFPEGEFATWERCERYLAQALAVVSLATWQDQPLPEVGELLTRIGRYLIGRGRFEEAEPLLAQALVLGEQLSGPKHPDLHPRLMALAELAWRQGKHMDAERILLRILSLEEQHPTSPHIQVGETLNNLALLYWEQGKYKQAEPLCQQALHLQETQLGPQHQDIANTLNNLALLSWRQGKYQQAEPLFQRALQIHEQALGSQHPENIQALNNLGVLYCEMGKYEQATPLFQKALQISEQALGAEHPLVGSSLIDLGMLFRLQGGYEQAENLYQRALQIREQALGAKHPFVAKVLSEQAMLYTEQGQYEQAESLFQRALQIQEQALGSNHPEVVLSLGGLAMLYMEQDRYEQAESLFQQALQSCEQVLGAEHPNMARILNGLATVYTKQGQYQQACPLYEQALHLCEWHLGPQHPQTAQTLHDLAVFHQQQGNICEATPLLEMALFIRCHALGKAHPKTLATLTLFAQMKQNLADQ